MCCHSLPENCWLYWWDLGLFCLFCCDQLVFSSHQGHPLTLCWSGNILIILYITHTNTLTFILYHHQRVTIVGFLNFCSIFTLLPAVPSSGVAAASHAPPHISHVTPATSGICISKIHPLSITASSFQSHGVTGPHIQQQTWCLGLYTRDRSTTMLF